MNALRIMGIAISVTKAWMDRHSRSFVSGQDKLMSSSWFFSVSQGKYRLRGGRSRGRSSSSVRDKIFFSTSSIPVLVPTQPPIQWVTGLFPPGVKRPGRETDHSPPTNAEAKNTWIYTSTPPISLHGVVLNLIRAGTSLPYLLPSTSSQIQYSLISL
jgi:hypothetical protein